MLTLIGTALFIAILLLGFAILKPDRLKAATAWLVTAGAGINAWLNSDMISGWFQ